MGFNDFLKEKGITFAAYRGMDRRTQLDYQDNYVKLTSPDHSAVASHSSRNGNGWWLCSLCSHHPCETLSELTQHHELDHPEQIAQWKEENSLPR